MALYEEKHSLKETLDRLRQLRESNERKSKEVLSYYFPTLPDNIKNNNERLLVLEQELYAALDCHDYDIAQYIILSLSQEFPGSMRVMRHQAALLEAEEKYDEAQNILKRIITADETNAAARKRRITILKAQGLRAEAITELVDYLKKFMSDAEAWQELCDLYLWSGEYARAAVCAEELLLQAPHAHLAHQRLADIRYTMGGVENLELAKSYYCHSLKLNPDNMRSLLGLFLTTNSLLNSYKSSGNSGKRKEVWRLCQWAQAQAAARQRPAPAPLTDMMLQLAIAD